jgi:hypothetical protein
MIPRAKIPGFQQPEPPTANLDDLLTNAIVDTSQPVAKPPVICEVRSGQYKSWQRLFTLGNFSAIIGKAKSRKTFFTSLLMAAMNTNAPVYDQLRGNMPAEKPGIIRIDTEQSRYDAWMVARRDEKLSFHQTDNYSTFTLREFSPLERCDIIEHILKKFDGRIGLMLIDGIADLANAINDEIEASRIVTLLLRWTKEYNCHICTVIHQNKRDSFATGHLGSSIMKKAEAVISVDKSETNGTTSVVSCDLIRGVYDFEPFSFQIDDEGLPVIIGINGVNSSFEEIRMTNEPIF